MNPKLKLFLLRWVNNAIAVMVAACIVPGIHAGSFAALAAASFLLGILNTFIRRTLILLALPLVIITLGFFIFVINAFLLYVVGRFMTSFQFPFRVDSFGAAFWGGLVISILSAILNLLVGASRARVQIHAAAPPGHGRDGDDGPVIDV